MCADSTTPSGGRPLGGGGRGTRAAVSITPVGSRSGGGPPLERRRHRRSRHERDGPRGQGRTPLPPPPSLAPAPTLRPCGPRPVAGRVRRRSSASLVKCVAGQMRHWSNASPVKCVACQTRPLASPPALSPRPALGPLGSQTHRRPNIPRRSNASAVKRRRPPHRRLGPPGSGYISSQQRRRRAAAPAGGIASLTPRPHRSATGPNRGRLSRPWRIGPGRSRRRRGRLGWGPPAVACRCRQTTAAPRQTPNRASRRARRPAPGQAPH